MADMLGVVAGSNGKIYKMNPANSEYDTEVSGIVTDEEMASALAGKASVTHASEHEHNGSDKVNQLGTVHFRGKVYAGAGDDNQGITEEITWNAGTLSIKKGIVVGWTPS